MQRLTVSIGILAVCLLAAGAHEADMLRSGQTLIAFLHPAAPGNHAMIRRLAQSGVTALTLDGIPRNEKTKKMDALASMSVCAGYKGVLMAADLLPRFVPRIELPAGTEEPLSALVLGVGVAGMTALQTLKGLGAKIYAADVREEARERARALDAELVDLPVSESGADAFLEREREVLSGVLPRMDIVVLSQLSMGRQAPTLVTGEMVESMKPGSVILDISIDQGGNCEATEPGETVVRHGIHIIGIKNIPGRLPQSSTVLFARNILHLFEYLAYEGKLILDRNDDVVRGILTTINGEVVHAGALEAMERRR